MTAKEQRKAAEVFAAKWLGRGYEKGECQKFWRGLLHDVFGVADPDDWVQYEVPVATGFVDAYISRTKVLVEQKGVGHGLADKAAMKQAMMYAGAMPDTMPVRYIVLSNFQEFWIYDKHAPEMKPARVALEDLPKRLSQLSFLTEIHRPVATVRDVAAVDKRAGELVGRLYSALLGSYVGEVDDRTLESLNMLCVRLVFCAYAEDAGVFPKRDQFVGYMRRYDAESFRDRLAQLFRMLNTDYADRDPEDIPDLLDFPYVGSGLFDDENIRIPRFTEETRTLLLDCLCADLDWTEINPTIFGAVFESTLSTAMRRRNGMHYTTVGNIHRVADPLFLTDLGKELDGISALGSVRKRNEALLAFQEKLGGLKFLDPACGSGNFLTETYVSLRRLENRAIALRQRGQGELDLGETIRVTIDQFFGIEIDGFAVSVAQAALWIAESQMMAETEEILHRRIDFLPLRRYAHIVRANALRMDWNSLLGEGEHFDYILGNPPFVGHQHRTKEQMSDMDEVYAEWKDTSYGKLDYVCAWYRKAVETIRGTSARAAFVSTNSICQGESVAAMWKPLFERGGLTIDFAWRTFVWDSEANEKAHVHVAIVGFHCEDGIPGGRADAHAIPRRPCLRDGVLDGIGGKRIFEGEICVEARHINGYLYDAPDVFIQNRGGPQTAGFAKMSKGSQPTDGGFLMLTGEERAELVLKWPKTETFVRRYLSADDYLNNRVRHCLWLKGVAPNAYRDVPPVMERLARIAELRRKSPTKSVQKDADTPMLFTQIRQPDTDYLVVPEVSSEKRRYIPIGFMPAEVIVSNMLYVIPNATLGMLGVLISSVHMAWMRVVAGRLEMRYRYTPAVYNNFPWPRSMNGASEDSDLIRRRIEKTAQAILDARALYPDSSLADLYDPLTMPPELRRAHQANDAAVLEAYGFPSDAAEGEIVARLFEMYAELTEGQA